MSPQNPSFLGSKLRGDMLSWPAKSRPLLSSRLTNTVARSCQALPSPFLSFCHLSLKSNGPQFFSCHQPSLSHGPAPHPPCHCPSTTGGMSPVPYRAVCAPVSTDGGSQPTDPTHQCREKPLPPPGSLVFWRRVRGARCWGLFMPTSGTSTSPRS